jgi:hypothetical protein
MISLTFLTQTIFQSGNTMWGTEPGKYNLGGKYDAAIQPMDESKQTLIDI